MVVEPVVEVKVEPPVVMTSVNADVVRAVEVAFAAPDDVETTVDVVIETLPAVFVPEAPARIDAADAVIVTPLAVEVNEASASAIHVRRGTIY